MQAATEAKVAPGGKAVVRGAGPIGTMVTIGCPAGGARATRRPRLGRNSILLRNTGALSRSISATKSRRGRRPVDRWLGSGCGLRRLGFAESLGDDHGSPAPGRRHRRRRPAGQPFELDVSTASAKEIRIEAMLRYAHQYERSIALLGSGSCGPEAADIRSSSPSRSRSRPSTARSRRDRAMSKLQIVMD